MFGGILALAAIGLSLVYGILNLANFAHGDFLTFGGLVAILFAVERADSIVPLGAGACLVLLLIVGVDAVAMRRLVKGERITLLAAGALLGVSTLAALGRRPGEGSTNATVVLATLLAVLASVFLLILLELLLWRPLRRRRSTVLALILVSIGVGLVVRNGLQLHFTASLRSFDRPTPESDILWGVRISEAQQLTLLLTLLLIGLLHVFLAHTGTGRAMRALADNFDLARVTGINVERTILYVWILAAALTATAGVLLTLVSNNTITVNTGVGLLLPLFAAVIVGGIGSTYGAIAGGFLVGIAMKTLPYLAALALDAPRLTQYEPASAFAVLILALLLRPQGLFGGRGA